MATFKTGFYKDANGDIHHFRKVNRAPSIVSDAITGTEDHCEYYAMPQNLVFLSRSCESPKVQQALASKAA